MCTVPTVLIDCTEEGCRKRKKAIFEQWGCARTGSTKLHKPPKTTQRCSRIEVFSTCRRERLYAICKFLMGQPWAHGSRRCKCQVTRLNWQTTRHRQRSLRAIEKIFIRATTKQADQLVAIVYAKESARIMTGSAQKRLASAVRPALGLPIQLLH